MTPIPDNWTRLQVYLPEWIMFKVRLEKPDWLSDSAAARVIFEFLASDDNLPLLQEIFDTTPNTWPENREYQNVYDEVDPD